MAATEVGRSWKASVRFKFAAPLPDVERAKNPARRNLRIHSAHCFRAGHRPENESDRNRLADYAGLFRLRAGHRVPAETPHAYQHRLFPGRTCAACLGVRPGLHFRQSGRAGSHRHGRLGREVWHRDQPVLLDRRHSSHGVCRPVHDAVLLRVQSTVSAGISETPL